MGRALLADGFIFCFLVLDSCSQEKKVNDLGEVGDSTVKSTVFWIGDQIVAYSRIRNMFQWLMYPVKRLRVYKRLDCHFINLRYLWCRVTSGYRSVVE